MDAQLNLLRMDIGNVLREVERVANQPEPLATWFSGIVALVAVLATALIALNQNRLLKDLKAAELRANVISESRKDWGTELRATVSAILSSIVSIHNAASHVQRDQLRLSISELIERVSYLELLLDPTKDSHQEVIDLVKSFILKTYQDVNAAPGPININISPSLVDFQDDERDESVLRHLFLLSVRNLLEDNWTKVRQLS